MMRQRLHRRLRMRRLEIHGISGWVGRVRVMGTYHWKLRYLRLRPLSWRQMPRSLRQMHLSFDVSIGSPMV